MSDALRRVMYEHVAAAKEVATAKPLTMKDVKADIVPTLEPDEMVSAMVFSARLLGLDERNSYVWMNWASEYAQHIEDSATRKALMDHVRRTRLLSVKLDPNKTRTIWAKEALAFAREQGWAVPASLRGTSAQATAPLIESPASADGGAQRAAFPAEQQTAPVTGPSIGMTRKALIDQHQHVWPTIESDIREASKNGLARVAKVGSRGWNEAAALEWARKKGRLVRIVTLPAKASPMPSLDSIPRRKHTLQG